MSVPITIPQSARNIFQDGIEQMAQQMQSRFRAWATVRTGCTGKSQAHRKIRATEMNDSTGRLQKTVAEEAYFEHRYLFPKKAVKATIIDEDDAGELDLAVAPTGEIGETHRAAAGRKIDDIFLAGIIGQNWEGVEDNMQPVNLGGNQIIAVNFRRDGLTANTGMTLAKLIAGKSRFGKNEVYGQEQKAAGAKLCCAVSQDELDDLLYDVEQIGSADYNKVKALVEGEVDYFMGINFMRTERLPTTAVVGGKTTRTCPMWVSTGVHLDFWYDIRTSIDVLPQQSHAIQVRSRLKAGSCRKDEDRVVLLLTEQDA